MFESMGGNSYFHVLWVIFNLPFDLCSIYTCRKRQLIETKQHQTEALFLKQYWDEQSKEYITNNVWHWRKNDQNSDRRLHGKKLEWMYPFYSKSEGKMEFDPCFFFRNEINTKNINLTDNFLFSGHIILNMPNRQTVSVVWVKHWPLMT